MESTNENNENNENTNETKTIEELIETLKSDDEFVQEEARMFLEMRKDESLEPMIEALKTNKNKDVKISLGKVLGFIGDPLAIPVLIDTLSDMNKLVRREASTALIKMGTPAVDPLIAILSDDDWKVRGAAAWALGGIGDKKALKPLENLLNDDSGFVKAGVKNSIAKLNE
ncbi:MAG: HEAT repeat domain-containing protein [Methanobrevibacter sp.]|jgi:HEAT repeat protein|nr:HEAT repeat domain-containing protein [Candidatus Methanoflexus mossambicus]